MTEKTVAQFSGGKDSLAVLCLNRYRWDDPDFYVMWVNTGAAYQETLDLMNIWRGRVKNFIEVQSDQPGNIREYGIPADVVPMAYTAFGRTLSYKPPYLLQSGFTCCAANIWLPLAQAVKELGATHIIRGQRDSEPTRGPVTDGQVVDGITYHLPLQHWAEEDVFDYLKQEGEAIPGYYPFEVTSRDCWDCTAYLDEGMRRIRRLSKSKKDRILSRLWLIEQAVNAESRHITLLTENRGQNYEHAESVTATAC